MALIELVTSFAIILIVFVGFQYLWHLALLLLWPKPKTILIENDSCSPFTPYNMMWILGETQVGKTQFCLTLQRRMFEQQLAGIQPSLSSVPSLVSNFFWGCSESVSLLEKSNDSTKKLDLAPSSRPSLPQCFQIRDVPGHLLAHQEGFNLGLDLYLVEKVHAKRLIRSNRKVNSKSNPADLIPTDLSSPLRLSFVFLCLASQWNAQMVPIGRQLASLVQEMIGICERHQLYTSDLCGSNTNTSLGKHRQQQSNQNDFTFDFHVLLIQDQDSSCRRAGSLARPINSKQSEISTSNDSRQNNCSCEIQSAQLWTEENKDFIACAHHQLEITWNSYFQHYTSLLNQNNLTKPVSSFQPTTTVPTTYASKSSALLTPKPQLNNQNTSNHRPDFLRNKVHFLPLCLNYQHCSRIIEHVQNIFPLAR